MRMKDWASTVLLAVLSVAYMVAAEHAQAQADAKATAVMTEVRKALGGEQKIASMKGLSLRADYRREMSAGPMPGGGGTFVVVGGGPAGPGGGDGHAVGKIEIDLGLPDRYLRADIGSSGMAITRTEGFEGSRPFLELAGNSPGMRVQTENPATDPVRAQAALKRTNADLARLLIGLTGNAQPGFNVSFTFAGDAESPDGKAHMIDVTGPDDFKMRLFVDTETKLPLMLSYMEPEPRMVMRTTRGGGPGEGRGAGATPIVIPSGRSVDLTPEQRAELDKARAEAAATPPKMIEQRLFFSDHRKVDGIALPYRIARGTGAKTTEEWDVKSYAVNPSFKADRFKIGS